MESQVFSKILRVIENEFNIAFNYKEYIKNDDSIITFPEFADVITKIYRRMLFLLNCADFF